MRRQLFVSVGEEVEISKGFGIEVEANAEGTFLVETRRGGLRKRHQVFRSQDIRLEEDHTQTLRVHTFEPLKVSDSGVLFLHTAQTTVKETAKPGKMRYVRPASHERRVVKTQLRELCHH